VILGSDGLWDDLSEDDAIQIVFSGIANQLSPSEIAELLVKQALTNAAQASDMSLSALQALSPGKMRRNLHDDTTAIVLIW
jgi:pyruvate dehydrogenase phosphatase